jgi:hypothetical protein
LNETLAAVCPGIELIDISKQFAAVATECIESVAETLVTWSGRAKPWAVRPFSYTLVCFIHDFPYKTKTGGMKMTVAPSARRAIEADNWEPLGGDARHSVRAHPWRILKRP